MQKIYDEFATTYDEHRGLFDMSEILEIYWRSLNRRKGTLLDLGCGAGEPFAKWFVGRGWQVKGVDFSEKMLALASRYVPGMETIQMDMKAVDFEPHQFNAVTSIYSLFHLSLADQDTLFRKVFHWLKPGGKMLFTYATKAYTGSDQFEGTIEFMGRPLFYAHTTPEALRNTLENLGFTVEDEQYRTLGGETFLWVTIRKERSEQ
jgi:cyclopropane fatty-acyl-phospholipid synthase-like methyltransferase